MCQACWKDFGSPKIVTEATLAAAKLIDEVYEHEDCGGSLHIVIDDWNLTDDNLEFCQKDLDEDPLDRKATVESIDAQRKCLSALSGLSFAERASAMAIHDKFFEPERKA